jgi:hypothetical protein
VPFCRLSPRELAACLECWNNTDWAGEPSAVHGEPVVCQFNCGGCQVAWPQFEMQQALSMRVLQLSFMLEEAPTSGSVKSTAEEKQKLAAQSLDFNVSCMFDLWSACARAVQVQRETCVCTCLCRWRTCNSGNCFPTGLSGSNKASSISTRPRRRCVDQDLIPLLCNTVVLKMHR